MIATLDFNLTFYLAILTGLYASHWADWSIRAGSHGGWRVPCSYVLALGWCLPRVANGTRQTSNFALDRLLMVLHSVSNCPYLAFSRLVVLAYTRDQPLYASLLVYSHGLSRWLTGTLRLHIRVR